MRNTFKVLFLHQEECAFTQWKHADHGTHYDQRTANAAVHATIRESNLWDVSMGRAAGRSAVASHVNEQLSQIRFHIERCYNTLFYEHALVTPKMVKEMYFGNDQRNETLLAFFRHHNEEFSRMVGISRSKTTYYKYRCVLQASRKLRQRQIQPQGFAVQRTRQRVPDGVSPLHRTGVRTQRKNTTWIYMIAFKHPHAGPQPGPHGQDLFANYKLRSEFVARNYLSMTEIRKADPSGPRRHDLTVGTRCILFSCFTGLSLHRPLHADPAAYPAGRQTAVDQHHPPQNRICGQRAHLRDPVHHSAEIQTDAAECADIPPAEQRLVQHLPRTHYVSGGHSPAHHVPFGPAHLRHDDHAFAGMAIRNDQQAAGT